MAAAGGGGGAFLAGPAYFAAPETSILTVRNRGYGALAGDPLWQAILQNFGASSDVMISRGGDLAHDIYSAMEEPIIAAAQEYPSMLEFIHNTSPPAIRDAIRARCVEYMRNEAAIVADFNNLKGGIQPVILDRTPGALGQLTSDLLANGYTHIVLDAQFGNIFKEGFGSVDAEHMTLLDACVSRIDGATKIKDERKLNGVQRETDAIPFIFDWFYSTPDLGQTRHTLSHKAEINTVECSFQKGASFSVYCRKGISVNAICTTANITAPRGTGEAAEEVTLDSPVVIRPSNLGNHLVFIKTMTDWAQIVYTLQRNLKGLRTILITNDRFCLDLAAAVGLPYVIFTPPTPYIHVYKFDPAANTLTAEEDDTIRAHIMQGITADQAGRIMGVFDNIYAEFIEVAERHRSVRMMPYFKAFILNEVAAIRSRIDELITLFPPGQNPQDVSKFRYLLRQTPLQYITYTMISLMNRLYVTYMEVSSDINPIVNAKDIKPDALDTVFDTLSIKFYNNLDIIKEFFSRLNMSNAVGKVGRAYDKEINEYLLERNITDGTVIRSQYIDNLKKIIEQLLRWFKSESVIQNLQTALQAGGAYQQGGSSSNYKDDISAVIEEYRAIPKEAIFLPRMLTEEEERSGVVDTYKPSVSAVISSYISELNTVDDLSTHLNRLMKVMEAWKVDAYETNIKSEFAIAKSDLYEWIEEMQSGAMTPTELSEKFAYTILVDPAISTLLPSLHPTEETLKLIDAIMHIATYAQPPLNMRKLAAAAAMSRRETQKNLAPITNRNLRPIGSSTAQKLPLEGVPLAERMGTIGGLATTADNTGVVYATSGQQRTRGGARRTRRHRRRITRRQATKTAAHRRRTIRKRK
jgi:hypothetical protein